MKFLFDLFPVILFFLTFKTYGIFVATAAAIAATFVQIGWLWFRYRKVDTMMWISLATIILLGGATLIFQDEVFIKWKPTVLYWLLAIILVIANILFKKNLIRLMLEKQVNLPMMVWNRLNASWIAFFILMGSANIYVAYGYSIDTWVSFKLFGSTGLMLIFMMVQVIMIGKYVKEMKTSITDSSYVIRPALVEENIENKKDKGQ